MKSSTCAGLCLSMSFAVWAQPTPTASEGVRLSTRLQALQPEAYPLGLMWTTPEEKRRQEGLYQNLQADLQRTQQPNMLRWLQSMPPTGRVPVSAADSAWLEANPKRNPLVQQQDGLSWPTQRPKSVRVLNELGLVCDVPHRSGLLAADYLRAWPSQHQPRFRAVPVHG